ncbi:DUF3369 domain-containing protein [Alteromonas aestuariivivens]|uniref:DUF3369 domain-containing protein n=1 Tax=Alteromonas aestuariivivens TaxID=1938339 RepID=A0A3D8MBC7_9ALTE|nr:DUF3369 domain-containing protein [Alteromonas aestuariivivens]RDV27572.1 DUF3369 domain-containing protein [Alteromonas aestuariivivens]
MNDDLLFAEDVEEEPREDLGQWKVLIVDDEPEVHAVTKLALSDFMLNGKTLEFISAYSGKEAKKRFREHDDIAVVLLDVVMESDDAGLQVAQFIRNELDNHFTRIILRTGQPGQAPEKDVIINYDINDYKSKTELTAQKLFTVIIAALRSYRDIIVIEESRAGLEKIIDASANLFSSRSLETFMQGIIQQMASILGCSRDVAYITTAVVAPNPISQHNPRELYVFAGNGEYAEKEGMLLKEAVNEHEYELCQQALREKSIVYAEDHVVAYCHSKTRSGSLLYLSGLPRRVSETDKRLIRRFAQNVQLAFDNIMVSEDTQRAQQDVIERLGNAVEQELPGSRHITRMVAMAEILARSMGLPEAEVATLKLAMPLHDVGNSRIPASLLNSDKVLSEEEKFAIRRHAEFGYEMLKGSDSATIQLAATLARQHHERWDGAGYPQGLSGEQIALESRMASALDVFDALLNTRSYKAAWPLEKVLELFEQQSGRQFDPVVVSHVLGNVDGLMAIQRRFPNTN